MKSVYLASPLGFATSTQAFLRELATRIGAVVTVHNPWDDVRFAGEFAALAREDSVARRDSRLREINHELGRANIGRIDASNGVVAILDGVDVDSGTAAEIGYAFAQGKRIYGLRTDFRLAGDNAGAIVNLQVEYCIRASGGDVLRTVEALLAALTEFAEK